MSNISFIVSDSGVITAFADNKSYTVAKDHPNYDAIKQAIKDGDAAKLEKLADLPKSIQNFASGRVEVRDGTVFYGNEPLHNAVTDRILHLMREGLPFEPVCRFLENLMQNPSGRSVNELYNFLSNKNLPITEDGHFLAYKRVRDDWRDIYSGKFDNSIGKVVEVPRNQVDDDFRRGCSYGLHVGAIEYVRGYSGVGCENGGHVVIVKVNPKDAVSVPSEDNCTKLRVCRYEVVGEYQGDLTAPLYSSSGSSLPPVPNNVPDEYDDYEEDEFWADDENYDNDSGHYAVPSHQPQTPMPEPPAAQSEPPKDETQNFGLTATGASPLPGPSAN